MLGVTTVTLQVTDDGLMRDTATVDITCSSGFASVALPDSPAGSNPLAMCVSGEGVEARPCVAYISSDRLFFARSQDAGGSAWDGFTQIDQILTSEIDTGMHDELSMASCVPGGIPIIAYGVSDLWGGSTYCTKTATDAACTQWYPRQQVLSSDPASNDHSGLGSSVCIINGKPVVSSGGHVHPDYPAAVVCSRALDSLGLQWDTTQPALVLTPPDDGYTNVVHTALTFGMSGGEMVPVCGFCSLETHDTYPSYFHTGLQGAGWALDAGASSWGGPQQFADDSWHLRVSAANIAGIPAIIYGSDDSSTEMRYIRADDTSGAGFSTGLRAIGAGCCATLLEYAGRPAVCYYDSVNGDLCFMTARDSAGDSWNAPGFIATAGNVGRSCAITLVNGRPVICYRELLATRFTRRTGRNSCGQGSKANRLLSILTYTRPSGPVTGMAGTSRQARSSLAGSRGGGI